MGLSFQRLLEILMEEKGFLDQQTYTTADLARQSGVGYQVIKNILDGSTANPSFLTLRALAQTLGVSISYFEVETEQEARTFIQRTHAQNDENDPDTDQLALRISHLSRSAQTDVLHLLDHIEAAERARTQPHLSAICIDDDPSSLLIMRGTLEDSHIRHEWYRTPSEGMAQLLEKPFDLAFIDIMMPAISGHDIARAVRQHPDQRKRDMVLVAVTAYAATEQQQREIYDAGYDEILHKPFDPLTFPAWLATLREKYAQRL